MIRTFEERQRRRLVEMRGRLSLEINRMLDALQEEAVPPGEHERGGAPSESIDKEVYLQNAEANIRRSVIAAIERIDGNTYGRCPGCGAKISRTRLNAIPYAERCVKCEQHRQPM
jgi:RNA polymerase-binding transcription factor DksA